MRYKLYVMLCLLLIVVVISFSINLKVGVYDNPPLVYKNNITKSPVGIFIDLLNYIAKENNWNVDYVFGTWEELFKKLKDGDIDVLPDVAYSEDRAKYIEYSKVVIANNWGIVYKRKSYAQTISNIFDLKNKKIAAVDDVYYSYLRNQFENFDVKAYFFKVSSYYQAFDLLNSGKVDFALVNKYFALYNSSKYPNIQRTELIFSPIQLRFAFRKTIDGNIVKILDSDLYQVMRTKNSSYYRIMKKYLYVSSKTYELPTWFYPLIIFILFILLTAFLFIVYLRHLVKSKTENIMRKNRELLKNKEELESSYQEIQAMNEELRFSYDELNKYTQTLRDIYSILAKIGYKNLSISEIANEILALSFKSIEEAEAGSISVGRDGTWVFLATVGHDKDGLNSLKIPSKYFIKPKDVNIVNYIQRNDDFPKVLRGKFSKYVLPVRESLVAPIKIGDDLYGNISLDILVGSDKKFSKASFKTLKAIAAIGSSFLTMDNYAKLQGELQKDVILSLIRIMEIFDPYTEGHSEFVAEKSSAFAQILGLDRNKVKMIYWAGLLHDIGKIGVPRTILNKPSKLTKEEYDIIKQHPVFGFNVLSASKKLKDLANIVRYHHERWDGMGYPDGLKKDGIPFEARIIAVIDTWHAMRGDRAYRKALSFESAREQIIEGMGTQFDPEIAKVFLDNIDKLDV